MMVLLVEGLQDIVVFAASRSLLTQLTEWSEKHPGFALRLISGCPEGAELSLHGAVFCVIDATTADPQSIVPVLEYCTDHFGADCVAVYSEVKHGSLETLVRSFGVLWWLGPMGLPQWEAVFRGLGPVEAPRPAPRRPKYLPSGDLGVDLRPTRPWRGKEASR